MGRSAKKRNEIKRPFCIGNVGKFSLFSVRVLFAFRFIFRGVIIYFHFIVLLYSRVWAFI